MTIKQTRGTWSAECGWHCNFIKSCPERVNEWRNRCQTRWVGWRRGHMALQVRVTTKTPCSEKSLQNEMDSQGSGETEAEWQGRREEKDFGSFFNKMWIYWRVLSREIICSTEFNVIFRATSLRTVWRRSKGQVGEISQEATVIMEVRNVGGFAYNGTNESGEGL